MRRFEFQLDPLLRLKQQQRRQAEIEVGFSQQNLGSARRRLNGLEAEMETQSQRIRRMWGPQLAGRAVSFRQSLRVLQHQIDEARIATQQAMQEHLVRVQKLTRVSIDVEAIETVREARWTEYVKVLQKAEQQELDWFVLRREITGKEAEHHG